METQVVQMPEGVDVHGISRHRIEVGTVRQHQEVGRAGTAVRPRPTRPILGKHARQIIEEILGGRPRIGNTSLRI